MLPTDSTNLHLNYITPTVSADGNGVFISDNGDIPTLTFFQIRQQEGSNVTADVVASIRMNNLEELKNFQKAIEETIRNHSTREQ